VKVKRERDKHESDTERERLKVKERKYNWFIWLGIWLAVLPILYLENTRLVFKLVFRKHKVYFSNLFQLRNIQQNNIKICIILQKRPLGRGINDFFFFFF
jgi:hypothetical protein